MWQVLRKHLLKDSREPDRLHTLLTCRGILQGGHWPHCINYHTHWDSRRWVTCSTTHSVSGSRLQNHIFQLPTPQFLDRDLTAKNARGFISNTMTPNSSGRYPETQKTGHWVSAQRAHNSSLRPSNMTETKRTVTKSLKTDQGLQDRN